MARPKGSGEGYVGPLASRVSHEVFEAFEEWRAAHGLKQGEAVRYLLTFALEHQGALDKRVPAQTVREEALLQARAELHRAVNLAWEKVKTSE